MPPTRTLPPAKAMKTERTHEENQERAYIAASRRSDRSLEARVESARRASEIHKRRTGRSLRVTEQDVINEEMYEEEDDDLPMAYRRLTAHLQTNSADFNQRLNAYITNQVAMRSALERSIAINNMNGSSEWLKPQMFQSPLFAHQNRQTMAAPQSPTSYRQAPYPSPRSQQSLPNVPHHHATSSASPQDSSAPASGSPSHASHLERRMSLPVKSEAVDAPNGSSPTAHSAIAAFSNPAFDEGQEQKPSFDAGTFAGVNHPFSLALPAESQLLLGNSLSQCSDPLIASMMAGSSNLPQHDFTEYKPGTDRKQALPPTSTGGLNDTLAPSTIDPTSLEWDYQHATDFFSQGKHRSATGTGSPGVDGESWGNFIDTDQWESSLGT